MTGMWKVMDTLLIDNNPSDGFFFSFPIILQDIRGTTTEETRLGKDMKEKKT